MEDQILEQEEPQPAIEWNYAGFWIRFLAYFIDLILVSIANLMVSAAVVGIDTMSDPTKGSTLQTAISILLPLLYFSLMQSSNKQATLGKMAVGVKVVNENGGVISFPQAIGRYLSKILSTIILFIGFIMVGFDSRKQALHDKIAKTFTVYDS